MPRAKRARNASPRPDARAKATTPGSAAALEPSGSTAAFDFDDGPGSVADARGGSILTDSSVVEELCRHSLLERAFRLGSEAPSAEAERASEAAASADPDEGPESSGEAEWSGAADKLVLRLMALQRAGDKDRFAAMRPVLRCGDAALAARARFLCAGE